MGGEQTIRIAQSCARDPREAVAEFHAGVAQPDTTLVIFFCSSEYDRDVLAAEMGRRFAGAQVVGLELPQIVEATDHSRAGRRRRS